MKTDHDANRVDLRLVQRKEPRGGQECYSSREPRARNATLWRSKNTPSVEWWSSMRLRKYPSGPGPRISGC